MPEQPHRWSDEKLEQFHQEFIDHIATEKKEHDQQQALFNAVFRKGDPDTGTPPGLLPMMVQVSKQMSEMQKWQDRQKTFVGGIVFAFSSVGFLFTDSAHKILDLLKRL